MIENAACYSIILLPILSYECGIQSERNRAVSLKALLAGDVFHAVGVPDRVYLALV